MNGHRWLAQTSSPSAAASASAWALWLALGLTPACDKHNDAEPGTETGPEPSAQSQNGVTSENLTTPNAFDLVATQRGALLVSARRDGTGSVIEGLALSITGQRQGRAVRLGRVEGSIRELAASLDQGRTETSPPPRAPTPMPATLATADSATATATNRLSIAWIEQRGAEHRLHALETDANALPLDPPAPVLDLGPLEFDARQARGQLAIASDASGTRLFARGGRESCQEAENTYCVGFAFHDFEPEGPRTRTALNVPEPCNSHTAHFAVLGGRWYYSVCSEPAGVRNSTVFTIQFEPEYARADQVLTGCGPRGLFATPEGMLFVGDCQGARRGVILPSSDENMRSVDLRAVQANCQGRALVITSGDWRTTIEKPTSHLEVVLPERFAGADSRASWTGQRLLVAEADESELALSNFGCSGSELVSQD